MVEKSLVEKIRNLIRPKFFADFLLQNTIIIENIAHCNRTSAHNFQDEELTINKTKIAESYIKIGI